MTSNKQFTNFDERGKNLAHDNSKKHDESYEEYTEKELEYLDRYKNFTKNNLDDEELYDIILKHNFDDKKITKELEDYMKLVYKKGEEFGWQRVVKGKSNCIVNV
jgi:cytidylate kinase